MPPIIEARGLTKHYGDVRALDGLDLTAESGRLTALLGPNGAGKTTFISAVATLLRPTAGELHVAGIDAAARPADVRRVIGLAGQYASVEEAMTGRENVFMVARLFGLDKAEATFAAGLADAIADGSLDGVGLWRSWAGPDGTARPDPAHVRAITAAVAEDLADGVDDAAS